MDPHVHAHPFRFYYTRGSAGEAEFHPHAGTKLAYQNRGVDTLQIRHPDVELQGGDAVRVTYTPPGGAASTVFRGTVEQITETAESGSDAWQDAVASSAWSKMDRLVFQQYWRASNVWSSNIILNQDSSGAPIGFKAQLNDIFAFAAERCGVTAGTLAGGQALPADEVRDLTCAQAVNRVLRWFPKKTVRLDYSGSTPAIELIDTTTPAPWAEAVDKASVVRTYNAHPIAGVYIETVTTGTTDGAQYRILGSQKYPSDARADAVDVLHATVMLEGASSSSSYEQFRTNAETAASWNQAAWWVGKHPRLARYKNMGDIGKVSLVSSARSGAADAAQYPNIAEASVEELTKFGLRARVETFTAHVKIADDDDIEEDVILQMKFVTSNVVSGKVYRRTVGSSSTSGESIPSNLAQAIYEDRSGALQALECGVRLSGAFPKIGETYEGLILQGFEVDVADLTASCRFGQPDHLSPDDMAGMLTGFRNRMRCSASWDRDSGKANAGDDEGDVWFYISPVEATEFCPGTKAKTTIKSTESGSGGTITLDSSEVDSGKDLAVHTLTVKTGEGENKEYQVLSTEDIKIGGEEEEEDPEDEDPYEGDDDYDPEDDQDPWYENPEDSPADPDGGSGCNSWSGDGPAGGGVARGGGWSGDNCGSVNDFDR